MHRVAHTVRNDTDAPADVLVEPWGMFLTLGAREAFQLEAEAPEPGDLEIIRGASIEIYLWPGAIVKVYSGDRLVYDTSGIPVPSVPPGMSIRQFMGLVGLDKIR